MLAPVAAVLLAACVAPLSGVTAATAYNYTVHAAVVFSRIGERTPQLDAPDSPVRLTSLGAQQSYAAGAAFRRRYLAASEDPANLVPPPPPPPPPPWISGLSTVYPHDGSVSAVAPDTEAAFASAQAFMQGLYPPTSLNASSLASVPAAPFLDPSSILANRTYIDSPLSGYQYARIHTLSGLDASSIFVAGDALCPALALSDAARLLSGGANDTDARVRELCATLGPATGLSAVLPESQWRFPNAYVIYDWLSYRASHNASAAALLSGPRLAAALDELRYLADRREWSRNSVGDGGGDEAGSAQLRAIAGRTLLAKVLAQLVSNVATSGARAKLTLLFGAHAPLQALFSLLSLPRQDPDFVGLPRWASAAVFELYSVDKTTADGSGGTSGRPSYPAEQDLWVRFHFRNGTADAPAGPSRLQMYSILGRGPSEAGVRWVDFRAEARRAMLADVGGWCEACQSYSLFCTAFTNTAGGGGGGAGAGWYGGGDGSGGAGAAMAPQVAGVVGAAAALGAVGVLAAAGALCGGLRVRRVAGAARGRSGGSSGLGGFKGSRKLASDQDLVIPKGAAAAAAAAAAVAGESKGLAERVGSWELRDGGPQKPALSGHGTGAPPPSYDEDDAAVSPFAEPVRPEERV